MPTVIEDSEGALILAPNVFPTFFLSLSLSCFFFFNILSQKKSLIIFSKFNLSISAPGA